MCLGQAPHVVLRYEGLPEQSWISIVDASLNGGAPCAKASVAAAGATSSGTGGSRLHSGPLKGGENVTPSPTSNREVNVLQASYLEGLTFVPLLSDAMKSATSFAVCYAAAGNATWVASNGTALDLTWADSNVRVTFSKITYASVRGVQYHVGGTLPVHSSLSIATFGSAVTLPAIALQGELTTGGGTPCANVAAGPTATGTGRVPMIVTQFGALTQTATIDTTALSTTYANLRRLKYALCYEDDIDGA